MARLMEQSGQTDAERRRLRQAQRQLQKTITENSEAMENPQEEVFSDVRSKNNRLFDKVAYTREAVLDGMNLDMIASRAARQVDALVQVPRYDPVRLTQKLRQKCMAKNRNSSFFDWHTLGVEAGSCFNAIPSRVQFLAGPLQADFTPKERKPRAKRASQQTPESDVEEERPEDVQNQQTNADQLSAVERNIAVLKKTLKKRSQDHRQYLKRKVDNLDPQEQAEAIKKFKGQAGEVCAINYMFNPRSFTQTVENIFHFGFMVKNGQAQVKNRNGRPRVKYLKNKGDAPPARQAIVALNMQDWRDLCQAYHVEKCDIPHRTGSKIKHAVKESPESQS